MCCPAVTAKRKLTWVTRNHRRETCVRYADNRVGDRGGRLSRLARPRAAARPGAPTSVRGGP